MSKKIFRLAASILVCNLAGIIGSVFTTPAIDSWYSTLVKPGFTPPEWLFGPVWITLYTLMGISFYLIWQRHKSPGASSAMVLFGIHLVLNSLWSLVFFGLKLTGWAFLNIVVLWVMIVWVMAWFYKFNKTATALLAPYLVWVSYAAVLNYAIWQLN